MGFWEKPSVYRHWLSIWQSDRRSWNGKILKPSTWCWQWLQQSELNWLKKKRRKTWACLLCVICSVVPDSLWTQVPLSMEFFRQEYWSVLSFPPMPGIQLGSPALQADSLSSELQRNPASSLLAASPLASHKGSSAPSLLATGKTDLNS